MPNIQVFNFESNQVRTVLKDNEVWFVASDVASILDYRDAFNMTRNLDDDESDTHNVSIRSENGAEQVREVTVINESGLYNAIIKSRKPEAKRFRKWVTAEVLPSVRKTGAYIMPAQITGDFLRQIAADMDRIKAERDEAVRTKAMIGSKREATAMSRLGNAVQKIKRLENKLGEGETFRAVSAIDWLEDYFDLSGSAESQIGKKLSELSRLHGIEVSSVSHKKYGSVKAYHVDAIAKFKQILDLDPSVLAKYRK